MVLTTVPDKKSGEKMELELMKDCLAAWMQHHSLSVAEVTEMLGFKSKTSVFRLRKGESNLQSLNSLYCQLSAHLDQEWQERFERALRVEKYGLERYQLFLAIHTSNFEEKTSASPSKFVGPVNDTIQICGHPWDQFFSALDTLLKRITRSFTTSCGRMFIFIHNYWPD